MFNGAAVRAIRRWEYTRSPDAKKNDFQVIRLVFLKEASESDSTEVDSADSSDESASDL